MPICSTGSAPACASRPARTVRQSRPTRRFGQRERRQFLEIRAVARSRLPEVSGLGRRSRVSVGRFDNPFWSPTDLVWYKDLGFDGFAVQAKHEVLDGFTPFAVAGAFPIYNTDLNAGINLGREPATGVPTKLASQDKWLFGGQAGFAAQVQSRIELPLRCRLLRLRQRPGTGFRAHVSWRSRIDVCDTDLTAAVVRPEGQHLYAACATSSGSSQHFGQTRPVSIFRSGQRVPAARRQRPGRFRRLPSRACRARRRICL